MDRKTKGGVKTTGKSKRVKATDKAEGKIKTSPLSCIGEICFTDEGFTVKVAKGANVECAKEIAKKIFSGDSKVTFEIDAVSEVEAES